MEFISTKTAIDVIMGQGLPVGKIVELFGEEASGKSSFVYRMAAGVQSQGFKVLLIDTENSFSLEYAKNVGLDPDNMIYSTESSVEGITSLIDTGHFDVCFIDSFCGIYPREDRDVRHIKNSASSNECSIVFTNQLRRNIQENRNTSYGNLKNLASIRLSLRKLRNRRKLGLIVGRNIEVHCVKNLILAPDKKVVIPIELGVGIG